MRTSGTVEAALLDCGNGRRVLREGKQMANMKVLGFVGLVCVALYFAPAPAQATTYTFFGGPFVGDFTVEGFFTGTDTPGGGHVGTLVGSELTEWEITFSPGTTGLTGFTLGSAFGDFLSVFIYRLGSGNFDDGEFAACVDVNCGFLPVFTYGLFGDVFVIVDANNMILDVPGEILVEPIPAPGAVWLFGSALLGIAGLKRRQRR